MDNVPKDLKGAQRAQRTYATMKDYLCLHVQMDPNSAPLRERPNSATVTMYL